MWSVEFGASKICAKFSRGELLNLCENLELLLRGEHASLGFGGVTSEELAWWVVPLLETPLVCTDIWVDTSPPSVALPLRVLGNPEGELKLVTGSVSSHRGTEGRAGRCQLTTKLLTSQREATG